MYHIHFLHFSFISHILLRQPLRSHLFPYTTLFRSYYLEQRNYVRLYETMLTGTFDPQKRRAFPKQAEINGKELQRQIAGDRKSTRLNSSHTVISYAVFCLKKKNERIICALKITLHS